MSVEPVRALARDEDTIAAAQIHASLVNSRALETGEAAAAVAAAAPAAVPQARVVGSTDANGPCTLAFEPLLRHLLRRQRVLRAARPHGPDDAAAGLLIVALERRRPAQRRSHDLQHVLPRAQIVRIDELLRRPPIRLHRPTPLPGRSSGHDARSCDRADGVPWPRCTPQSPAPRTAVRQRRSAGWRSGSIGRAGRSAIARCVGQADRAGCRHSRRRGSDAASELRWSSEDQCGLRGAGGETRRRKQRTVALRQTARHW